MTFLEYLISKHVGPRARKGTSEGESWWCCPFHLDDTASFHTMPHKPEHKDRFYCFGCGRRGDCYDFLKELYPTKDYGWRRSEVEALEIAFSKGQAVRPAAGPNGVGKGSSKNAPSLIFRGVPTGCDSMLHYLHIFQENRKMIAKKRKEIDPVWAYLSEFERAVLAEALRIWERIKDEVPTCSLTDIAAYCLHFEEWKKETDREHLDECNDSDCPAIVCRKARGLPPLTRKEIEAGRREVLAKRASRN